MTKDEMIEQLLQQVNSLSTTIAAQTALIAQLNHTIQELKEQINKNSKNSSRPPSSDGLKKPSPKSLRKPSEKKAGGQVGHQGTHPAVIAKPDDVTGHMPSACEGCPHYKMCKGTACVVERRHVIDAVVTVNVTEHQLLEIPVSVLRKDTKKGVFPTGTISNMVKRCADAVSGTVNTIKQKVVESGPGHFDETGTRVYKKLWWVHDASNCEFTYPDISPKRGHPGMEQCGVLPLFRGIAMHDCWASYWSYTDMQHAVCCAHLLRELTGIIENHPGQKWASAFIDLLLYMKKVKDKAIEARKESLGYYHKFDKRYKEF